MVNLTIDGRPAQVPEGTTILEAARQADIHIPHLCYLKGINEIAACRVCCVEVEGERAMVTACNNPVQEGMAVHTNSPRARSTRRINVELILSQHDCKCATCVRSGNCQLQEIANDLGILELPFEIQLPQGLRKAWTTTFPLFHDYNKCIKCMRCKTYTLLPDQDPADLYEEDFEHDGFLYSMSDIIKEEQHFQEENLHTEVVTVTTASKNLEDILAELKPTIEFDDGISSGTLSLDHSTIKTEAAGYKSSSYTVTATKNYTGLDRNDSSYIDKTVEKNGRTLSLSNVTWSVERTALVGDELVPATYSAVATYSGTASSTVATGYITTAEYKGTVVSSGISSILYTVTYLGTEIVPVEEEPTFNGSIVVIPVIGGTILLATLLLLGLLLRKNTTVYKATGKGNEYEKCGRLRLKTKDPELRIDRLKDIPEGMIAVEVDQAVAKKLFGQTIAIHCYDNTVEHTVGTVNGQYWFKVDIGTQEGEPDTEEEPV